MNPRLAFPAIAIAASIAGPLDARASRPGQLPSMARSADVAPATDLPSRAAAQVINWVIVSRDNNARPFMVIDKVTAELFVFKAFGRTYMQAPVLLGIAKGDLSAPGVGDRELSQIPVAQRTTPAGRYWAYFGSATGYKNDVLWVDYATAISLHPVVTTNPSERRLARLKSPTPKDNRITFGCINVDAEFYKKVIAPLFRRGGVVYIVPETRSLGETFAGSAIDAP